MKGSKSNKILILFCSLFLFFSSGSASAQIGYIGPGMISSWPLFNPYMYRNLGPAMIYPIPLLVPCRPSFNPLILPPFPYRRAAATTVTTLPSLTLLSGGITSPTSLLASLLFSPLPSTTTVTNTAIFPGTIPTSVVPNNVTANTIQNYNYSTTVTVTPILPGLTSLFLPLLI